MIVNCNVKKHHMLQQIHCSHSSTQLPNFNSSQVQLLWSWISHCMVAMHACRYLKAWLQLLHYDDKHWSSPTSFLQPRYNLWNLLCGIVVLSINRKLFMKVLNSHFSFTRLSFSLDGTGYALRLSILYGRRVPNKCLLSQVMKHKHNNVFDRVGYITCAVLNGSIEERKGEHLIGT